MYVPVNCDSIGSGAGPVPVPVPGCCRNQCWPINIWTIMNTSSTPWIKVPYLEWRKWIWQCRLQYGHHFIWLTISWKHIYLIITSIDCTDVIYFYELCICYDTFTLQCLASLLLTGAGRPLWCRSCRRWLHWNLLIDFSATCVGCDVASLAVPPQCLHPY